MDHSSIFGAAPQAGGPPQRAKRDSTDEQLALKLAVMNAQQTRLLQAAVFKTISINVDSTLYIKMAQALSSYEARTKGNKGHGQGAPDTYACIGVIIEMATSATDDTKALLDDYVKTHMPGSKKAQNEIYLFRCEKMFDPKIKRLSICLENKAIEELIISAVETAGITRFTGPRPAGYLEKRAQDLIDGKS